MEQGRENVGRICPRGASYYTWEAGDTLARVAQINGTTEQALRDTNRGVDFATLPAGETICIPANVLTCPDGEPYTVRQGDTFASIADSLGIGVDTLQARNQGTDPNALTTGSGDLHSPADDGRRRHPAADAPDHRRNADASFHRRDANAPVNRRDAAAADHQPELPRRLHAH